MQEPKLGAKAGRKRSTTGDGWQPDKSSNLGLGRM